MKQHNLFDRPAQIGAYLRAPGGLAKHDIIGDTGAAACSPGGVRRRPQDPRPWPAEVKLTERIAFAPASAAS
jgi:hypothetical protein